MIVRLVPFTDFTQRTQNHQCLLCGQVISSTNRGYRWWLDQDYQDDMHEDIMHLGIKEETYPDQDGSVYIWLCNKCEIKAEDSDMKVDQYIQVVVKELM